MKYLTLDEMINKVKEVEAETKESTETYQRLTITAMAVIEASEKGKIAILTDYDADGITSAYIMEKLVKSVNPDCTVTVKCNDRRTSYGLSEDVQGEEDTQYIVLDMGSNQLDLAKERLGEDVIIIDHHLIESEEVRKQFKSLENKGLCNLHCFSQDESENAQYCTAGLSYRLYEEAKNLCKAFEKPFQTDIKKDNTVLAVACIGTATDMVNVLDKNSYNRDILKRGIEAIDNADENNFDFVMGNVLARNGIGERATAYSLAFNVGAFINASSRMSELAEENGAEMMYKALTGTANVNTFRALDKLEELNRERKEYISELVKEEVYKQFVSEHRFGSEKESDIGLYLLPDEVPSAFAGLVAGRLSEQLDKAIIALTYNEKEGYYTGSGRNAESNQNSLKEFVDKALFGKDIEIKYGGHSDAIGISRLKDIEAFDKAIRECPEKLYKPKEMCCLKISPKELGTEETLEKMLSLEPTGVGLKVPPVVLSGKELRRNMGFIKGRDDWKRVQVKCENETLSVTDWSYDEKNYPQDKGNIKLVAEIKLNDFKGLHTELSAKHLRNDDFLKKEKTQVQTK